MITNRTLKTVILADNKVSDDVIALLSGRLRGSIMDLCDSLLTKELETPYMYR